MRKVNLLMIEDDDDTNFLLDYLLRKLPYVDEFFIKERAQDGLDFLSTCHTPLNCIFVDINMPEMDGFEFVENYEKNFMNKFPDTVVYFLTSSARLSDRQKAKDLISVKGFILKPLTKDKLFKIHSDLFPAGEGD